MRDLPEWVWKLIEQINRYEDEHPILYRMTDPDVYVPTQCVNEYIAGIIPREVMQASEVMTARFGYMHKEVDA